MGRKPGCNGWARPKTAPNPDDERSIHRHDQGQVLREQHSQHADGTPNADPLAQQAIQLAEQLQGELDAMRDQLAWSNRLGQLGMLTAALAHEMNNLLTPVGSYAQLALANPDNDRLTERALHAAITGARKSARLIESVMELANPKPIITTEQAIAAAVCRVNEVVEDAIACMLPIVKQQGVDVVSRVEPSLAAIDALALEQVLINLISNACQAMADMPGKRQIRIESDVSNDRLALRVIDTGPGVGEAVCERLFEPFVTTAGANGGSPSLLAEQTDQAANHGTAGQHKGSGLGLSICKQIIESAGGSITLTDSSDSGSTFQIDLPPPASA